MITGRRFNTRKDQTGPAADKVAPAVPRDLVAAGIADGVSLDWAGNSDADLAGSTGNASSSDGLGIAGRHRRTVEAHRPRRHGHQRRHQPDWADQDDPDLAGYLVARSSTADGTYTTLTDAPISASTYEDTTAPRDTSFYRVTAVDTAGNISAPATAQGIRTASVVGADVTVAQDGSGDFTTVADALAAARSSSATPYVIGIQPGVYRELLTVSKPNITFLGATEDASDVVISYDNAALTQKPDGSGTYGTSRQRHGPDQVQQRHRPQPDDRERLRRDRRRQRAGRGPQDAGRPARVRQRPAPRRPGHAVRGLSVRRHPGPFVLHRLLRRGRRRLHPRSRHRGLRRQHPEGVEPWQQLQQRVRHRGEHRQEPPVRLPHHRQRHRERRTANTFSLGPPWQPSGDVNAIAQVTVRDTVFPAAIKRSPWTEMTTTFSWRDARFFEYNNTGPGAGVNADRPQLSDLQGAVVHQVHLPSRQ